MHPVPIRRLVVVAYHVLAEEVGLWCDGCLLPARVRLVVGWTANGVPCNVTRFEGCESGCPDRIP